MQDESESGLLLPQSVQFVVDKAFAVRYIIHRRSLICLTPLILFDWKVLVFHDVTLAGYELRDLRAA